MDDKFKLLIGELGENRIKRDVDLSGQLQTGLGGPAAAFYIATTTRELVKAVELCRELKIDFLVIGSGSKIAISEKGFDGLAIKNRSDSVKIFGVKGKVSREGIGVEEALLEADSGMSLAGLASYAGQQKLGGLDVLLQSAGTIGGSFRVNVTLSEKASQVKVLSPGGYLQTKEPSEISREDIILSVVFKLKAKK